MPTTFSLLRSFAGGEITPDLFGRIDLAKNQTGLQVCRNFVVLPQGPVENRAGFRCVAPAKTNNATKLIPFTFSVEQSLALEFGDQYIRFHTEGGTLLEASKTINGVTQADPAVFSVLSHGYSTGNWVYVQTIPEGPSFLSGGLVEITNRYFVVTVLTPGTFTLTDPVTGDVLDTSTFTPYVNGGTVARVYEIAAPYVAADVFSIHYTQSADVLTLVHPNYAPRELRRTGATNWTLSTISFAPNIAAPTGVSAAATGTGTTSYTYIITSVNDVEESLASAATTPITNDLSTAGNFNTVGWDEVVGITRYNVYRDLNGLFGYIGQASGDTFVDDNILPDTTKTPPEFTNPFGATGDYPAAIGYFDQRRIFAGTNNLPQTVWMTRPGTESNLAVSVPTNDGDSIRFRIFSREVSRIRHIVPVTSLLFLTSGVEYRLQTQNSDILSPNTIAIRPDSYEGSNDVQPVATGNAVVYAQARGGHIRQMLYSWEQQAFKSDDISILAPHLFDGFTITDLAYTKAPDKMIWAVRNDGVLLGLTYLPEQEVVAWHKHDTTGTFQSVCSISEGIDDSLYAVVRRELRGVEWQYIEKQADRRVTSLANGYFLDCGATYSGTPTTTVYGLGYLEGETVTLLADGATLPTQTVVDGSVTVPVAASVVHVGLPYTSDMQTPPIALQGAPAFGQGILKNLSNVHIRVVDSSQIKAGPSFDRLRPYRQRTTEPYGSPPRLVSGMAEILLDNFWNLDGTICIRQDQPLPLTVSALALEIAVGG